TASRARRTASSTTSCSTVANPTSTSKSSGSASRETQPPDGKRRRTTQPDGHGPDPEPRFDQGRLRMAMVMRFFGAATEPRDIGRALWLLVVVPVAALALFLALWAAIAPRIQTSLGAVPGPEQVMEQAHALYRDHRAER